jgi:hypothetical protein
MTRGLTVRKKLVDLSRYHLAVLVVLASVRHLGRT